PPAAGVMPSASGPPNRVSDAGLSMLLLVVVRNMTARCTCSGSAAGDRLQVERSDCGETVAWLDGCWVRQPRPSAGAPPSTLIYYTNQAFYGCQIRNRLRPARSDPTASCTIFSSQYTSKPTRPRPERLAIRGACPLSLFLRVRFRV